MEQGNYHIANRFTNISKINIYYNDDGKINGLSGLKGIAFDNINYDMFENWEIMIMLSSIQEDKNKWLLDNLLIPTK